MPCGFVALSDPLGFSRAGLPRHVSLPHLCGFSLPLFLKMQAYPWKSGHNRTTESQNPKPTYGSQWAQHPQLVWPCGKTVDFRRFPVTSTPRSSQFPVAFDFVSRNLVPGMDGPRGYGLPMAGGLHGVDGSSGDVSGTSLRPDGPHDAFLHESLMQGDELRARSREQGAFGAPESHLLVAHHHLLLFVTTERLPTVIVNYLPPTLTEAEFHVRQYVLYLLRGCNILGKPRVMV